jgi:hypothetical protein
MSVFLKFENLAKSTGMVSGCGVSGKGGMGVSGTKRNNPP